MLLGFKERYAAAIVARTKTQTIRKERRKGNAIAGDTLHMYVGLRTPSSRKLGEAVCTDVQRVELRAGGIFVNGSKLTRESAEGFARADGFQSVDKMLMFFEGEYGLPFRGLVIRWGTTFKL